MDDSKINKGEKTCYLQEKEYSFKLLDEESSDEDLIEGSPHESVARSIFNVVFADQSKGSTIGLEGGWGSGKSTVIKLFKKIIDKEKPETKYFYFDAWAHEGDPLRRVFLEDLIGQVGDGDTELSELKEQLSKRKKKVTSTTNSSATKLGKILSILVLFVPLGIGIISGTIDQITIKWGNPLHIPFIFGLVFSLFPLAAIVCNLLKIRRFNRSLKRAGKTKKNNLIKEWAFLNSETVLTSSQEISEDEERSSIEFERHFHEILQSILINETDDRLVIIIDNLDRINAHDSLKIWSTLQTYLQKRNPVKSKSKSLFEKVWTIVPYDEEGLKKLWDKENDTLVDGELIKRSSSCSQSFFDKCFQLRFEVPKVLNTAWIELCRKKMKVALIGWKDDEKETAINILRWSRKGIIDTPSPREIKIFINQIGLLKSTRSEFTVDAISIFVILRYLLFNSKQLISEMIMNHDEFIKKLIPYKRNSQEIWQELCGLIYGVSQKIGLQILLESKIKRLLMNSKLEELMNIRQNYKDGFWQVFDFHIQSITNPDEIAKYCKTLWKSLYESHKGKCTNFISHISKKIKSWEEQGIPEPIHIDDYSALLQIIEDSNGPIEHLCSIYKKSFIENIQRESSNHKTTIESYKILSQGLSNYSRMAFGQHELSFVIWERISPFLNDDPFYKEIFIPDDSLVNSMSNKIKMLVIKQGYTQKEYEKNFIGLIRYCTTFNFNNWLPLLDSMDIVFEKNSLPHALLAYSMVPLEIFYLFDFSKNQIQDRMKSILRKMVFWQVLFQRKEEFPEEQKIALIFLAAHFSNNITTVVPTPTNIPSALSFFQTTRNAWFSPNAANAKFVLEYCKSFIGYDFIWHLMQDKRNRLIIDILQEAINKNNKDFFRSVKGDAINRFRLSLQFIDNNSGKESLAICFKKYSSILSQFLKEDVDIVQDNEMISFLINKTKSKRFHDKIIQKLKDVSEQQWGSDIVSETGSVSIAKSLQNMGYKLDLDNHFYNAFIKIVTNYNNYSDSLIEELSSLYSFMGNGFQKEFSIALTGFLINSDFIVPEQLNTFYKNHLDKDNLFNKHCDDVEKKISELVNLPGTPDMPSLLFIAELLEGYNNFIPAERFTEILRKPINDLYNRLPEGSLQKTLLFIAPFFKIQIDKKKEIDNE